MCDGRFALASMLGESRLICELLVSVGCLCTRKQSGSRRRCDLSPLSTESATSRTARTRSLPGSRVRRRRADYSVCVCLVQKRRRAAARCQQSRLSCAHAKSNKKIFTFPFRKVAYVPDGPNTGATKGRASAPEARTKLGEPRFKSCRATYGSVLRPTDACCASIRPPLWATSS